MRARVYFILKCAQYACVRVGVCERGACGLEPTVRLFSKNIVFTECLWSVEVCGGGGGSGGCCGGGAL